MKYGQHEVQDLLEEINLGKIEDLKIIYVSAILEERIKQDLIGLFTNYKDCFAWNYDDMSDLDRGWLKTYSESNNDSNRFYKLHEVC